LKIPAPIPPSTSTRAWEAGMPRKSTGRRRFPTLRGPNRASSPPARVDLGDISSDPRKVGRPLPFQTQMKGVLPPSHSSPADGVARCAASSDPCPRFGWRTATGPGSRDLLRSPSGFGGRPGGSRSRRSRPVRRHGDRVTSRAGIRRPGRDEEQESCRGSGGTPTRRGNRCCGLSERDGGPPFWRPQEGALRRDSAPTSHRWAPARCGGLSPSRPARRPSA